MSGNPALLVYSDYVQCSFYSDLLNQTSMMLQNLVNVLML